MATLIYTNSKSEKDLQGILELQKNNLPVNLSKEEITAQGFVTVIHSLSDLKNMNDIEQHVICKDGEKIIGYLLAMTVESQADLPVLIPMFEEFNKIFYLGKSVSEYKYIVIGQVCIDKDYRGQGILDKCYETYKNCFKNKYDFAITEISSRNLRSIQAHKRIGFSEIHKYTSPDLEEWSVIILKW
jgi:GNAT superfamily N-acetyltransferase